MRIDALERPVGRRALLRGLGMASVSVWLAPGCGYFPAEEGDAFSPWSFPDAEQATTLRMAKAAILAASPHNTQPWLFEISEREVRLWADHERGLGSMDSQQRELFIGLGCALENMRLAAGDAGHSCALALLPDPAQPALVASLTLEDERVERDPLFDAIARRHTNRGRYADVEAPPELAGALRAQLADEELSFTWLGSAQERARMREETIAATRAIIDDQTMSRDSFRWYRHGHDEIERHRDGVTLDATGKGALTRALGKMVDKPSRADADAYWLDATKHEQTTGSAFVILGSEGGDERAAQLRAGMAYQRMHLWATANGLAMQPLNQLTERRDREESEGLTPRFGHVLAELSASSTARAQMIFRVGYPWDDAFKSPRRPLGWVQL